MPGIIFPLYMPVTMGCSIHISKFKVVIEENAVANFNSKSISVHV
jgi:hypothetical protein